MIWVGLTIIDDSAGVAAGASGVAGVILSATYNSQRMSRFRGTSIHIVRTAEQLLEQLQQPQG
jgi:hypothetical protein